MPVDIPTKPIEKSWTFWLNVASIAVLFIGSIVNEAANLGIPPTVLAWLVVINGAGNVALRVLRTNLPIGPEGGTKTVETPFPKEIG